MRVNWSRNEKINWSEKVKIINNENEEEMEKRSTIEAVYLIDYYNY